MKNLHGFQHGKSYIMIYALMQIQAYHVIKIIGITLDADLRALTTTWSQPLTPMWSSPKYWTLSCSPPPPLSLGCKHVQVDNSWTPLHRFKAWVAQNIILILNFVMLKTINILKTYWSTKPNKMCWVFFFSRNVYIFLKTIQVVWYRTSNCLKYVYDMINLH